MNNRIENQFLEYLEGTLSAEAVRAIEEEFKRDPVMAKSFDDYKRVVAAEKAIARMDEAPAPGFTSKVMAHVSEISEARASFWRKVMDSMINRRMVTGGLATLATLCVVLKLATHNEADISKQIEQRIAEKSVPVVQVAPVVPEEVPVADGRGDAFLADKSADKEVDKAKNEAAAASAPVIPAPVAREQQQHTTVANLSGVAKKSRESALLGSRGVSNSIAIASTASDAAIMQGVLEQRRKIAAAQSGGMLNPWMEPQLPKAFVNDNVSSMPVAESAEQYNQWVENPRINVAQEALSTFGADVDTASYSNARRFLKAGQLPPRDSIRVEEFINYFDYSYPVQTDKPFTLSYEMAPSPLEKDRMLLKLGIKARDVKSVEKPWNLVFLIDVSGSMQDTDKLPLVKSALKLLTEKMRANDRIAIVTYAGSTGIALDSTTVKEKAKILAAIDSLGAGGSTNGSAGITLAYDVAQRNRIEGGVNRVVLATDGDFNVGLTSQADLIRMIEEKRKSGTTLTTLGFGTDNLKDGTMEQLANKGNGNYFYIDSFAEARKVLDTDLVGTMEVVAKDLKLQIEFNPAHVANYRLIGYENRLLKKEDFNNDKIDSGEVGAGHTVTALYEITLAGSELAKQQAPEYRYQTSTPVPTVAAEKVLSPEMAFLKIRFKEPEGSESKLLQFPIMKKDAKTEVAQATDDFRFAAAVSYFAHLLRESQFAGSYSLNDIAQLAQGAAGKDERGYRREFVELVRDAAALKH